MWLIMLASQGGCRGGAAKDPIFSPGPMRTVEDEPVEETRETTYGPVLGIGTTPTIFHRAIIIKFQHLKDFFSSSGLQALSVRQYVST